MNINILTYPDVLLTFFQTRNKFSKNRLEWNIQNIIENPYNIHTISKEYLGFLSEYFDQNNLLNTFESFIVEMSDLNRIESCNTENNDEIDKVFLEICNSFSKTIHGISMDDKFFPISNYVSIGNYLICRRTKLYLDLIKNRIHTASFANFLNINDVLSFFNDIYKFPKKFDKVVIIDRYVNTSHPFFDFFKQNSIPILYYTLNVDMIKVTALRRVVDDFIFYHTRNEHLIHERTILIDKICINSNEDFQYIGNRNTWTIIVEYSSNKVNDYTRKCSEFTKSILK